MPAAEPHIVAHFVPLSVIMSDHGGDLASYMAASGSGNVVVTMPVTMDVVGRGTQSFFVAVAVTWHFDSAAPLQDALLQPIVRRGTNACSHGCPLTVPGRMSSVSTSMISAPERRCRTAWSQR